MIRTTTRPIGLMALGAALVVDFAICGQPVDGPARYAALLHAYFCVMTQFHVRSPV